MGVINIENTDYGVGNKQGSLVRIPLGVNEWLLKKRNKGESDKAMEARVANDVAQLRKVRYGVHTIAYARIFC
jgi:hypothetical protein